jgi:hypothetical protein
LPFFLKVTTSLAVLPGWISGVCFPLILKSCVTWPMFLKTKVTLPGFAVDLVGSRKKNSPPLTWIAVPCVVAEEPALPLAPEPALEEVAACVF